MFKYFLVSSQVHFEKNALSEASWILSTYSEIDSFKAKLLPVGGLGLLEVENEITIPPSVQDTINTLLKTDKIYYCFKIVPLEIFDKFSEELIYSWVDSHKENITENETWRITINKRHSSTKTSSLITNVAKKISNPVDLKNPDKIVQIEIVGKFVGLSILEPYQAIQLTNQLSKLPGTGEEEEDEEEEDIGD